MIKNFKKNQIVIFVIALMLVTAGYLNFANQQKNNQNLLATSSLADSEEMAAIGDATLVSANQVVEGENQNNIVNTESNNTNSEISNSVNNENTEKNNNVNDISNSNVNNENPNAQTNNQVNAQTNSQTSTEDGYFAQSRLDRDNMYSQMLENYQKILETDNLASEEKSNAQEEIQRINNEKNAIMIAENLIKTKGFEDVVLFVNNGNVTAVVKANSLDVQQVAQIQNIITRELNVKVNKINVSVKNS